MAAKKRPDVATHAAMTESGDIVFCKIRKPKKSTQHWPDVDCIPCMCDMIEAMTRKVERLMEAKWSGSGRVTNPGIGRKLPRAQMEWEK